MEARLILETTFVIDLEREAGAGARGPCASLLQAYGNAELFITHTTAGELACGVTVAQRQRWERLTARFALLPHTIDVDWNYAQAFRHLRRQGTPIDANDLWIAAAGLAYGLPIVTRNVDHFHRVPGLEVIGY